MRLVDALAASMREGTEIERDVLGTEDPAAAASLFEAFCARHFCARVASCSFYVSSVGCVAGVVLDDGRHVVVKAHQPDKAEARLAACQAVQGRVAAAGFPAPRPLLAPQPLGLGLAVAEEHVRAGEVPNGHEPSVRRVLAAGLFELTRLVPPESAPAGLGGAWFSTLGSRLWPRPHNALFDFEGTARGAEWIDALAARARTAPIAGEPVVAHFDWRVEHILMRDGRITTVYDWDSLHLEREPIVVGAAAYAFTARWDLEPLPDPTPTLDEMCAFVTDYEDARSRPFTSAERATLWASVTYSVAYVARCQHSRDPGWKQRRGFRERLRDDGEALLRLVTSP